MLLGHSLVHRILVCIRKGKVGINSILPSDVLGPFLDSCNQFWNCVAMQWRPVLLNSLGADRMQLDDYTIHSHALIISSIEAFVSLLLSENSSHRGT